MSASDYIWDKIKSLPFPVFGLEGQTLQQHVMRLDIPDEPRVFLKVKAGAVVPMLDEVLGKHYTIEQTELYMIISDPNPIPKKIESAVAADKVEKLAAKVKKLTKK
jgi:hypothetical protein